jgi:hypothetical protein
VLILLENNLQIIVETEEVYEKFMVDKILNLDTLKCDAILYYFKLKLIFQ